MNVAQFDIDILTDLPYVFPMTYKLVFCIIPWRISEQMSISGPSKYMNVRCTDLGMNEAKGEEQ
jgi:hypothetical protein